MSVAGVNTSKVMSAFPQGKPNNWRRHELNWVGLRSFLGEAKYKTLPYICLANRKISCGKPDFVMVREVPIPGFYRGEDEEGTSYLVIRIKTKDGGDYCESVAII